MFTSPGITYNSAVGENTSALVVRILGDPFSNMAFSPRIEFGPIIFS